MLIENALGAVNLLVFIEISSIVSRSERIGQVIGREMRGKIDEISINSHLLSLLVDTSGVISKLSKSEFQFWMTIV